MAISTEKLLKLTQFQTGLQAAKDYADEVAADAKKAGTDAQAAVTQLSQYVGTIPDGATSTDVVSYVQEKTSGIATSAALQELNGKVGTLVGTDTGKSARAIAAEETAKIVAGADASYDTLKEIADWISSHQTDATSMNSAIVKLQGILAGIGGTDEKATVVKYVTDAIAALKISDYAKAADLTALAARVSALETDKADKATTLAGYGITDAYTKTAVESKIKELINSNVTINVATDQEVAAVCTAVFGE